MMKKVVKKNFPDEWKPYPFQKPLWNYLYHGGKKAIAIWHRRAGKDLLGLHWIIVAAFKEVGIYWYVYPTYAQAKISVWDGQTLEGRPYISYIPKNLIKNSQQYKQRIVLINGSIIQFVGSNRSSNIRGSGIKGAIISEYSYQDPRILRVIEPMILRNNGWLLFLYTPADDPKLTHGEILYERYKSDKDVYCEIKTIDDTTDLKGNRLYTAEQVREGDMTEEEIQREYYCNFEAYKYKRGELAGTFCKELREAEAEGRIGYVPYDPAYKVNTYWDVGVTDFTAIWFVQEKMDWIDIIDFFIKRGYDMEFYLTHLKGMSYVYGKNVLPHDINRRQFPTLNTRLLDCNRIAEKLGFSHFELGRKYVREQMLEKAKKLFASCRIDETKCKDGLDELYKFDASKRGIHSSSKKCVDTADAFCYMAMDVKTQKEQDFLQLNVNRFRNVVNKYNPYEY